MTTTLIELERGFAGYTKKGGRIILSGVLREQMDEVNSAYRKDFDMQPPILLDDWSLLTGIRH